MQTEWSLLANGRRVDWQLTDKNLPGIMLASIDKAVDNLAKPMTMVNNRTQDLNTGQVTLTVTNVKTVSDYAKVLAYLSKIPLISQIDLKKMLSSQVVLELTLTDDEENLEKIFASSQVLLPVKDKKPVESSHSSLIYQWSP